MSQVYSDPSRSEEPYSLPDVEVFEAPVMECPDCGATLPGWEDTECWCGAEMIPQDRDAWWWWACFPGCLPDGDANGPFDTEEEALEDVQEDYF